VFITGSGRQPQMFTVGIIPSKMKGHERYFSLNRLRHRIIYFTCLLWRFF